MCEIAEPYDCCTLWNWDPRKARKKHKCDCCGGAIHPGSKYFVHSSLYEGSWSKEKCCADCDAAQNEFSEAHGDMSWSPSGFRDALSDCISEEDEETKRWDAMHEAMVARAVAATA